LATLGSGAERHRGDSIPHRCHLPNGLLGIECRTQRSSAKTLPHNVLHRDGDETHRQRRGSRCRESTRQWKTSGNAEMVSLHRSNAVLQNHTQFTRAPSRRQQFGQESFERVLVTNFSPGLVARTIRASLSSNEPVPVAGMSNLAARLAKIRLGRQLMAAR
jgi:hypothetical protein